MQNDGNTVGPSASSGQRPSTSSGHDPSTGSGQGPSTSSGQGQKSYSLSEVLRSIQSVLNTAYANKIFWVTCELSRITVHKQTGHCYLELIEKNESSVVAQLHGIIWSEKYKMISEKFFAVTKTKFDSGIKVMFQCAVNFHAVHGLSLIVNDIEPAFTLGEMVRMKNEAIARLKTEGLFDRNRKQVLPLLPGRIAVISASNSRGYLDFVSTIENYQKKFQITYRLFEAILQGDKATPSIIHAMGLIHALQNKFDALVIVRGGAGDAGLSCYDEYALAATIANFPMPVITGIGHSTNETVSEMVSFKNCITPTAAATFLIEKFELQANLIAENMAILQKTTKQFLSETKQSLFSSSELFKLHLNHRLNEQKLILKNLHASLPSLVKNYFKNSRQLIAQSREQIILNTKTSTEKNKKLIEFATQKIHLLDPVNTLKRGFSITRYNGKAITNVDAIDDGMKIETTLSDGTIKSTVDKK